MQLDEMGLQIGSLIQIQLVDDESKKYTVQLIGFHKENGLIISAPKSSGSELSMILRDDQPLILRIKSAKNTAVFRSRILEKRLTPYPHLHIAIPDEIESKAVEQSEMIYMKQDVTFINDDEDCHSTKTKLSGISMFEAAIKNKGHLADEGQRVTVTMSFPFAGINNVIVLEGVISNASDNVKTGIQTLTLSYEELEQSDRILLHAYIYERMLINMKILDDPSG